MTDLEDAEAREHTAAWMHFRLRQAVARGEPVAGLTRHAHTEWMAARNHLADVASTEHRAWLAAP